MFDNFNDGEYRLECVFEGL